MTDTEKLGEEPHRRFLIAQVAWFGGLAALITLITLISMWMQGGNHDEKLNDRQEIVNRNDFWRQLHGDTPIKANTVRGQLARDLRPFLSDDIIQSSKDSKLIPDNLKDLRIDSERYIDLGNELGDFYVFEGESECWDCGKFNGSFLGTFEQVRSNRMGDVIEPVPPKPTLRYTATLGAAPFIPYLIVWGLVLSLLSFLLAMLCLPYRYRYNLSGGYNRNWYYPNRYRNWRLDGKETTQKVASMLLALPIFVVWWIVRIPVGTFSVFARTWERVVTRRSTLEQIKQHPFGTELQRARVNLARLQELPQTTEVKKALKDTQSLITELEGVPLQISKSGAKVIANDILRENQEIRDKPKALLEAHDEIW